MFRKNDISIILIFKKKSYSIEFRFHVFLKLRPKPGNSANLYHQNHEMRYYAKNIQMGMQSTFPNLAQEEQ